MLLRGKYDNINRNYVILGASVIKCLKKQQFATEDLFQKCKKETEMDLDQFLDVITFLWTLGVISFDNGFFFLNFSPKSRESTNNQSSLGY